MRVWRRDRPDRDISARRRCPRPLQPLRSHFACLPDPQQRSSGRKRRRRVSKRFAMSHSCETCWHASTPESSRTRSLRSRTTTLRRPNPVARRAGSVTYNVSATTCFRRCLLRLARPACRGNHANAMIWHWISVMGPVLARAAHIRSSLPTQLGTEIRESATQHVLQRNPLLQSAPLDNRSRAAPVAALGPKVAPETAYRRSALRRVGFA